MNNEPEEGDPVDDLGIEIEVVVEEETPDITRKILRPYCWQVAMTGAQLSACGVVLIGMQTEIPRRLASVIGCGVEVVLKSANIRQYTFSITLKPQPQESATVYQSRVQAVQAWYVAHGLEPEEIS